MWYNVILMFVVVALYAPLAVSAPVVVESCHDTGSSLYEDGQVAAKAGALRPGMKSVRVDSFDLPWPHTVSVGTPNRGALLNPVRLKSDHTLQSRRYRSYGTRELVELIRQATHAVHRAFPNSPRLHVGDLSKKHGGHFPPHVSHQSGRDVDIGYYMRFGQRAARLQRINKYNLDIPRTWVLMETFLRSGQIQYMFSHRKLIPSLYRYARKLPHISKTELKRWFGGKGRRGIIRHLKGHDDHLHIRIYAPDSLAANHEYARRYGAEALRSHIESWPKKYRIKRGDTLESIASRHEVTVGELVEMNPRLKRSKRIRRGRRLVVGYRHPWDKEKPSYITYEQKRERAPSRYLGTRQFVPAYADLVAALTVRKQDAFDRLWSGLSMKSLLAWTVSQAPTQSVHKPFGWLQPSRRLLMAERLFKWGHGHSQDTTSQADMALPDGHLVAESQALTLTGKATESFVETGSNVALRSGTSTSREKHRDWRQSRPRETTKVIKAVGTQVSSVSGLNKTKTLKPAVRMTSKMPKRRSDTADKSTTYVVRSGDTLWAIAKKFNVSLPHLCRANAIQKDCSLLGLKRRTSPLVRGRVLVIQGRG